MDLVSIIIPVYNAEQYLEYSIDSALKQTYSNIEVILIDDGSVDNSNNICLEFCAKDSRVKYFYQKNSGVSVARNHGLEQAQGDWICFLDADDWMELNQIKHLLNLAQKYSVEIVQGALCHSTLPKRKDFNQNGFLFENIEIIKMLLSPFQYSKVEKVKEANLLNSTQGCYGKLFARNLLKRHNIKFPLSTRLGEDMLFYYNCLLNVRNVVILDEQLYNYRVYANSTTQKCNPRLPKMLEEFLNTIKLLENTQSYTQFETEWKYAVLLHLRLVLNMYYWHEQNVEDKQFLANSLNQFLRDPIVHDALHSTNLRYLTNYRVNYNTISYLLKIQILKLGNSGITFNICIVDTIVNKILEIVKNTLKKLVKIILMVMVSE